MIIRTRDAVAAPLILAGLLTVAACGGSSPAGAGGAPAGPAGGSTTAAAANGAGAGTAGDSSCSGGLTAADPGVVDVFCGGPADIKVTAGSLTKDFTGGSCHQAGGVWSASAGVVTEYGVYKGKPVDVVTVNNQATAGKGTIQLTLSGHVLFADSASFALEGGGSGAHLSGTAQSLPEGPDTPVTVDVTC
ncbi:MAG TPA: hypothetical protein VH520_00390 [Streptosporangiaceae bacterium]|jgi:hypothetical protein